MPGRETEISYSLVYTPTTAQAGPGRGWWAPDDWSRHCCLPGSASAGSWGQERCPARRIRDAGVPSSVFSATPNASPLAAFRKAKPRSGARAGKRRPLLDSQVCCCGRERQCSLTAGKHPRLWAPAVLRRPPAVSTWLTGLGQVSLVSARGRGALWEQACSARLPW